MGRRDTKTKKRGAPEQARVGKLQYRFLVQAPQLSQSDSDKIRKDAAKVPGRSSAAIYGQWTVHMKESIERYKSSGGSKNPADDRKSLAFAWAWAAVTKVGGRELSDKEFVKAVTEHRPSETDKTLTIKSSPEPKAEATAFRREAPNRAFPLFEAQHALNQTKELSKRRPEPNWARPGAHHHPKAHEDDARAKRLIELLQQGDESTRKTLLGVACGLVQEPAIAEHDFRSLFAEAYKQMKEKPTEQNLRQSAIYAYSLKAYAFEEFCEGAELSKEDARYCKQVEAKMQQSSLNPSEQRDKAAVAILHYLVEQTPQRFSEAVALAKAAPSKTLPVDDAFAKSVLAAMGDA